jgi:hypothetical protein
MPEPPTDRSPPLPWAPPGPPKTATSRDPRALVAAGASGTAGEAPCTPVPAPIDSALRPPVWQANRTRQPPDLAPTPAYPRRTAHGVGAPLTRHALASPRHRTHSHTRTYWRRYGRGHSRPTLLPQPSALPQAPRRRVPTPHRPGDSRPPRGLCGHPTALGSSA